MPNFMDIVHGCENYLGWKPEHRPGDPVWRARSIEAMKLRKAIEATPGTTIENVVLALEYSRQRRLSITSPAALVYRVDAALAVTYIPPTVSEIAAKIVDAINWERDNEDHASLKWIHRLTRANGEGRTDVLAEWVADGRGPTPAPRKRTTKQTQAPA